MPSESELDQIAEALLAGGNEDSENSAKSQAHEDEPPGSPPDTQAATAEPADPVEGQDDADDKAPADKGDDDAEFYARKVPGTEFTVGELKDKAKDLAKAEELKAQSASEQNEFRTEVLRFKRMLQASGGQLSSEQQQAYAEFEQAGMQRETDLILTAIPAWSEQTTVLADAGEIAKAWAPYGLTDGEVNRLLATDARFAKREYDLLLERRALDAAKAKVVSARKKAQAPTRSKPRTAKAELDALSRDESLSAEDRGLAALLGGMHE